MYKILKASIKFMSKGLIILDFDILMGVRAGASTCAVTYGNSTEAELREAGADAIISRFADLQDIDWIRERA